MAWTQLSDFDKGQIVASNDCRLSLHIAKKLNCYHSSIEVFFKNKKTTNYHKKKEVCDSKRKTITHLTKRTFITIIKENNHFLCVPKLTEFH